MTFTGRDEIRYSDGSTAQKVAAVDANGSQVVPARETGGNLATILSEAQKFTTDQIEKDPAAIAKTFAAAGTGAALFASATPARNAWFLARRSATTANSGDVWVADANNNALAVLSPGDFFALAIDAGTCVDLAKLKVNGAVDGDGVLGGYQPV